MNLASATGVLKIPKKGYLFFQITFYLWASLLENSVGITFAPF